jgi:hypothetical protein
MRLDDQVAALLAVVEAHRSSATGELLARARAESRRIVAEAHAAARQRLYNALAHERERLAASVRAAEANLQTRRRLHRQAEVAAVLRQAWVRLEAALVARWQSGANRALWVQRHLERAIAALPALGWEIAHPPSWGAEEREEAVRWLAARGVGGVRTMVDTSIRAGVRIRAGHNLMDATLEGLLADREAIEGRLLHYLEGAPA